GLVIHMFRQHRKHVYRPTLRRRFSPLTVARLSGLILKERGRMDVCSSQRCGRTFPLHFTVLSLFNVQILSKHKRHSILSLLLLCIVSFSVVFSQQGQDMRPRVSAANSTPYLERLELVTANGGSTDSANGGNQWGNHKT